MKHGVQGPNFNPDPDDVIAYLLLVWLIPAFIFARLLLGIYLALPSN